VEGVDEVIPEKILKRKHKKEPKPKEEKKKEEIKNTAVYVTGLPHDATMEEVEEVFKKGGVFFIDPLTNQPKIKLYKDENGGVKGDALVMYLREESVALACELLDDSQFRFNENTKLKVQPAEFKQKDPAAIKPKVVVEKKKRCLRLIR
jgi:HIV Tat-specific factor 1